MGVDRRIFGGGRSSRWYCQERGGRVSDVRLLWGSDDLKFPAVQEDSGGDYVAYHVVIILKGGAPIAIYSKVIHDKRPDPQLS